MKESYYWWDWEWGQWGDHIAHKRKEPIACVQRPDLMVPRVGHSLPLRDPLLQVQRGDGHGSLADPVGQPVREVDPPPVRTENDSQTFRFI